jgi:hypothetical protein
LDVIETALRGNGGVEIIRVDEENSLPTVSSPASSVDFWVAPKNGLYTASELNQFMRGLIPLELEPTYVKDFREMGRLFFGRFWFDETIGKASVSYDVTDSRLMDTNGIVNGAYRQNVDLVRQTAVSVFPCTSFIADLERGELPNSSTFYILDEHLQRYRAE